jgi:hypothetical protein
MTFKEGKLMEELKIYNITPQAIKLYRREANNYRDISEEVLKRKLTAIVYSCKDRNLLYQDVYLYKFNGFNMVVNEKNLIVEHLYWDDEKHSPKFGTKDIIAKYHNYLKELGLNKKGNDFLNSIKP